MSSPKKIKDPRLIKITRELKNLEDAVKKKKDLETEIIIESAERRLCAIEKEKINKINEL